ncbi:MAG: helix-turn-helix transcriptional regulator [Nostoc sp. DedSLP03]|uniref:helix-turn-helix domain-containing protein n=1 Tax=Nostoc sp. DedSLP03 TaxID=3075400 RepID=UPI002AD20696|nr:helix-turn-helix transcriptional regulator [Nostoc sp. DedSLP03]MDZ7970559.1 helix-turn-helix transcriptional regulator [Nostoc sp. DedSLP03]
MELTLMRVTFSKEIPGLGEKIKALRKASPKSLTELAAEAGISTPHWHRVENEKIQELPIETLRSIEKALGAKLDIEV